MKYLLLVHHNEDDFAKMPESQRSGLLAESIRLCHELAAKGKYHSASPLQPSSTATVVRVRDGKRSLSDGPFIETREQVAGYFLIEAENLDEALEVAGRVPGARIGSVEVRPLRHVEGLPGEKEASNS
jgi:hypothetical protein